MNDLYDNNQKQVLLNKIEILFQELYSTLPFYATWLDIEKSIDSLEKDIKALI